MNQLGRFMITDSALYNEAVKIIYSDNDTVPTFRILPEEGLAMMVDDIHIIGVDME